MPELRGSTLGRGTFWPCCFVRFSFQLFFYLLAGFILFTEFPLYSFTRCCVKSISIFAYEAFEWREYLGDRFFCSGNRSVVCLTHSLPNVLHTEWA